MHKNYVMVLIESLEKKLKVLEEIKRLCDIQKNIVQTSPFDFIKFDQIVDDKDICLEKIEKLDEGFESVYERVKGEFSTNKDVYADEIKRMQELITKITDIGSEITVADKRTKKDLAEVMLNERKGYAESKRSVNVALNYYKNMTGLSSSDSMYMDDKK